MICRDSMWWRPTGAGRKLSPAQRQTAAEPVDDHNQGCGRPTSAGMLCTARPPQPEAMRPPRQYRPALSSRRPGSAPGSTRPPWVAHHIQHMPPLPGSHSICGSLRPFHMPGGSSSISQAPSPMVAHDDGHGVHMMTAMVCILAHDDGHGVHMMTAMVRIFAHDDGHGVHMMTAMVRNFSAISISVCNGPIPKPSLFRQLTKQPGPRPYCLFPTGFFI